MVVETGATTASSPPTSARGEWLAAQGREDEFVAARRGPRRRATTRPSGSTWRRSSRWSRCRRRRATSSRSREVAGTEVVQVCVGSSVNSLLRGPRDRRGGAARTQRRTRRVELTVTPGSRQILDTIVRSRRLRRPRRARARGCSSRCAGRASASARRRRGRSRRCARSTATSPAAAAPTDDAIYLCSPATAAATRADAARSPTRGRSATPPRDPAAAGRARRSTTARSSRRRRPRRRRGVEVARGPRTSCRRRRPAAAARRRSTGAC